MRAFVLTVSDRCFRGEAKDLSGPAVASVLASAQAHVECGLVPDEKDQISEAIRDAAKHFELVLTTGGTGLSPRDVTPEATIAVCEKLVPGLAEQMRRDGQENTPMAVLSRGVCGIVGSTLVINLPGSPGGAVQSLGSVLPVLKHALDVLGGRSKHPSDHAVEPGTVK